MKIIEQALDGPARGAATSPTDRKVALPPRHELATSMEALIHHFKLVTEGFRVPPGEVYYPIESPRGELGCFVRSDGSSKPARVHMRDPRFVNLQAFAHMARGRLHRRPDRDAGDARPDPRRHRPVSAPRTRDAEESSRPAARARRAALRARLARPRLGRGGRPREGPGRGPRPRRRSRSRPQLRSEIEAHMASYPDRRSAALPALAAAQRAARLVLAGGDRAGRLRDARDARPTWRRSRASTTCSRRRPSGATRLRVHEHLLLAARRRRAATRRSARRPPRIPTFNVRAFECLGACDIAPMASVDGVYVGPLEPGDVAAAARGRARRARRCCRRSSSPAGRWPTRAPTAATG